MRATLIALPLIAAVAVAASTAFAVQGPSAEPASPAERQADALRQQLAKERRGWETIRTRLTRENRALERQNRRMRASAGGSVSAANRHLRAIALCESGGDADAVSRGGTYRGKYQFDYRTWRSVGGSGDPARAPEAEQDWRAYLLYERRGAQPWPVCG